MKNTNIILIILDAVRPDHLGCYGHHRDTSPNIDQIAKNGVVYENAFANSNWTGTSHASLFTGMMPSHSGIYGANQEIPSEIPTLAERLKGQGYSTFATSAGINLRSERGYNRGFDRYDETFRIRPNLDYLQRVLTDPTHIKQALFTVTRGHDNYAKYKFDSLKKWIHNIDQPFFSFINAKTAHHPYNPPRPYKSIFNDELERPRLEIIERLLQKLGRSAQKVPDENMDRLQSLSRDYPIIADDITPKENEIAIIEQWYDGAIRYLDELLGDLIKFLEKESIKENTTVIIASDHGELFGEHGLGKHRYSLFDNLIRVPLIIKNCNDVNRRISQPVSLLNLHPTILESAGIDNSLPSYAQSLLPFNEVPDQDYLYAEVGSKAEETVQRRHPEFDGSSFDGPLQSIRSDQYKLIRYPDNSMELYDWQNDTEELHDISNQKPNVCDELETILLKNMGSMKENQIENSVDNPYLKQKLKELGYI